MGVSIKITALPILNIIISVPVFSPLCVGESLIRFGKSPLFWTSEAFKYFIIKKQKKERITK